MCAVNEMHNIKAVLSCVKDIINDMADTPFDYIADSHLQDAVEWCIKDGTNLIDHLHVSDGQFNVDTSRMGIDFCLQCIDYVCKAKQELDRVKTEEFKYKRLIAGMQQMLDYILVSAGLLRRDILDCPISDTSMDIPNS